MKSSILFLPTIWKNSKYVSGKNELNKYTTTIHTKMCADYVFVNGADVAAKTGNLIELQHIFDTHGHQVCRLFKNKDAVELHLNLTYMHHIGCIWNTYVCTYAAINGHLDCLKCAHEYGCPWTLETCLHAALNGHLDCLIYAYENGCPWDSKWIRIYAAKHNNCTAYVDNIIPSGGVLPAGLDYKQDRPLMRNDKLRYPQDMGLHFYVFPTMAMSKEEFEEKLTELIGGCDHTGKLITPPTPAYSTQPLLRQVSATLFELATSGRVDPNRSFRALYFHYLLAEPEAQYDWVLRGDALTYYTAQALELSETSLNINVEEIRDEIRGALAEIIMYTPVYRSYPDDYYEVEKTSVVLFGECLENPQIR